MKPALLQIQDERTSTLTIGSARFLSPHPLYSVSEYGERGRATAFGGVVQFDQSTGLFCGGSNDFGKLLHNKDVFPKSFQKINIF